MGITKESTGSYHQLGFATFGVLAAVAFILVAALHRQWLTWACLRRRVWASTGQWPWLE